MRLTGIAVLIGLAVSWPRPCAAQSAGAELTGDSARQRASPLVDIIEHRGTPNPFTIASAIRTGLNDDDPVVRQTALAAVVARAAPPRGGQSRAALDVWRRDHSEMQALRVVVQAALSDPIESVRVEAVTAYVSLDTDPSRRAPALTAMSERTLLNRYYADGSSRVRARIVAGFGTDSNADSPAVKRLLRAAFDDPAPQVRHAATSGAEKLASTVAIPLLVRQLQDVDRFVRAQSAATLLRYQAGLAAYETGIESAMLNEHDLQVRELLRALMRRLAASR